MIQETLQRSVATSVCRRADTATEQRYLAMIEQTPDGIFFFDDDTGYVLYSNAAFERMLGFSAEELLGMRISDFIVHDRADAGYQEQFTGAESTLIESIFLRKDGTIVGVEASVTPVFYANKREWCAVVRDVTGRKMQEERLKHKASHDPLTDLPNRALFLETLERATAEASRQRIPIAVLFVDLDDFKKINDTCGHHYGDKVLTIVADRLKSCVRAGDMVARIGGDEFTVLVGHSPGRKELTRLAERLATRLREPFPASGTTIHTEIGASIGVSMSFPSTSGGTDVLHRADLAMYSAKKAGKARWIFTENRNRGGTGGLGTIASKRHTHTEAG